MNLTFDTVKHSGGGYNAQYDLDWSDGEPVIYKSPMRRVHVYQGDRVTISNLGDRDPQFRRQLKSIGIDARSVSQDCTGVKFFKPDGMPIPKAHIATKYVMFDHKSERALTCHWDEPITYLCKGAMPYGSNIKLLIPNPVKEAEVTAAIKDELSFAITYNELTPYGKRYGSYKATHMYYVMRWLERKAAGEAEPLTVEKNPDLLLQLGGAVAMKDAIRHVSLTKEEPDFLYFKEQ